MEEKANYDSVTTVPCGCTYLERAAAEPSSPIQYDGKLREYQFANLTDGGHSLIYHCPWCGGVAPRSQRDREFALVTWAEIRRLESLTESVGTPEQAVATFGPPQRELARGVTVQVPASDSEPERTESYRTLAFTGLSAIRRRNVGRLRGPGRQVAVRAQAPRRTRRRGLTTRCS